MEGRQRRGVEYCGGGSNGDIALIVVMVINEDRWMIREIMVTGMTVKVIRSMVKWCIKHTNYASVNEFH